MLLFRTHHHGLLLEDLSRAPARVLPWRRAGERGEGSSRVQQKTGRTQTFDEVSNIITLKSSAAPVRYLFVCCAVVRQKRARPDRARGIPPLATS